MALQLPAGAVAPRSLHAIAIGGHLRARPCTPAARRAARCMQGGTWPGPCDHLSPSPLPSPWLLATCASVLGCCLRISAFAPLTALYTLRRTFCSPTSLAAGAAGCEHAPDQCRDTGSGVQQHHLQRADALHSAAGEPCHCIRRNAPAVCYSRAAAIGASAVGLSCASTAPSMSNATPTPDL